MGRFFRRSTKPAKVVLRTDPGTVEVAVGRGDDELLESWVRSCSSIEPSAQAVSAWRSDQPEFAWSVSFALGEFVTDPDDSQALHEAVVAALMEVPGINAVGRDDKEVWAVDGDAQGPDIVRAGAVAIDQFLHHHPHVFSL